MVWDSFPWVTKNKKTKKEKKSSLWKKIYIREKDMRLGEYLQRNFFAWGRTEELKKMLLQILRFGFFEESKHIFLSPSRAWGKSGFCNKSYSLFSGLLEEDLHNWS
jgi:hypothetical protein